MKCANHPHRNATQLCIGCGQWYCEACTQRTSQGFRCKKCVYGEVSISTIDAVAGTERLVKILLPLVAGIDGITFLTLSVVLSLLFGNFNFLWLALLGLPGIGYLLHKSRFKIFSKIIPKSLNDRQVFVAINLRGGKITAHRLALMTSVSEEKAKEKLNQMTIEGKLDSYVSEDAKIIYTPLELLD